MSEIVIRGGTVIDGTGAPGVLADVAIDGGRISAIGVGLEGNRVLDATGHVASSAASGTFGLDPTTADCMATVIRPAVFDPPGPNGAKLNVPLRFRPDAPPPARAPVADAGASHFP